MEIEGNQGEKDEGSRGTGTEIGHTVGKEIVEGAEKKRPYSNSRITTYQTCPKKEHLTYDLNYYPRKRASALSFGTAVHEGLMALHLHRENQGEQINKVVEEYTTPIGESTRTKENLRKVFDKYIAEKLPVPWEETLEVEKELYFHAGVHRFVVIPDLVIRWNGAIFGVDHKTTGRFVDNFFQKFKRDTQIDAQMLAIKEKYGACHGIYINGIVVRKGGPTSKLPNVEFVRDIAERTGEELESARENFKQWVERILEDKQKPENRINCFKYNSACHFLPLCTGRVEKAEEYYEVKPWTPKEEPVEED